MSNLSFKRSMNEDVDDSELQMNGDNNTFSDLEVPIVKSQISKKIKIIINDPVPVSNVNKVLEHLSKKQKISHSALDAVDMLMMSHAKSIKSFSTKRQAFAKKKISEFVSDLEILKRSNIISQ